MDATIETIRRQGIAKVSARTIAATGGVSQALIFYHFGSVSQLLGDACIESTRARVEHFAARLDAVESFGDLVKVAEELSEEERGAGNVNVLAQVLAASQSDPELADSMGRALGLWTERIERVMSRLLPRSPLAEIIDARSLAQLVSASFIGIELVGTTRPPGTDDSSTALQRLASAAALLDGLGPISRRAVRAGMRRHTHRPA